MANPEHLKNYCQKYQDVTPSPLERAGVRPPTGYPNFTLQVPKKTHLSVGEGRGEASNWQSDFIWQYNKNRTRQWQQ